MRKALLRRIIVIVICLALLGYAANALFHAARRVGVNQGYEPDQPIPYSHKIHAGDNKIPCLYCHFGAEKGRHAGIPSANVCMNCHKKIKVDSPEIAKIREAIKTNTPIEWVKVHHLPDYAYFNHSQHVVAGKVVCQDCHGPVETMTLMRQENLLTMGWCIECHRKKGIMPPKDHSGEKVSSDKSIGGLDCGKCHY